jgi:hypothetical protein
MSAFADRGPIADIPDSPTRFLPFRAGNVDAARIAEIADVRGAKSATRNLPFVNPNF